MVQEMVTNVHMEKCKEPMKHRRLFIDETTGHRFFVLYCDAHYKEVFSGEETQ